jgi:hypothetical protein
MEFFIIKNYVNLINSFIHILDEWKKSFMHNEDECKMIHPHHFYKMCMQFINPHSLD